MNIRTLILISLLLPIGSFMNGQISDNVGDNTRFGQAAGLNNANSDNEILQVSFFGRSAGLDNTGEANSFFGYSAGRLNSTGMDNSFFGHRSGFSNTTGSRNSFFGRLAGQFNGTASDNSFFGYTAGDSTTTGEENSFFGSKAGFSNSVGSSNSFYGFQSGLNNSSGINNSFFGAGAGSDNTTGSHNIYIGHNVNLNYVDGAEADSTLLVGIGGNTPLLYGHFGQREMAVNGDFFVNGTTQLNGDFEVNGAFFGGSSKYIKKDFASVDPQEILEKVIALPISTWTYINKPNVRHIGPMAQDFYAAFGLGKDDVTIATVDADGLALASIQALHLQLEEEKKINKDQLDMIQSLLARIEKLENK